MKVRRIHIDASVIGGCFDEEFAPWSKGLMEDSRLGNFKPGVSKVVALEVVGAPEEVQETYAEMLSLEHEFSEAIAEAMELADHYLRRGILSPNGYNDAQHIALATIAEADVLTNWSFRHAVHSCKICRLNAVNLELGYKSIEIRSPRDLTNYRPEAKDV